MRSAADLGPATARIADELNKQYTIGYQLRRSRPMAAGGRFASASEAARYFVRARRGYFAQPTR